MKRLGLSIVSRRGNAEDLIESHLGATVRGGRGALAALRPSKGDWF